MPPSSRDVSARPLYATLGLTDTAASAGDIARAYRRRAVLCHPDRNPDGAEDFKALAAAYAVLSDSQRRALYDATGATGEGATCDGGGETPEARAARGAELAAEVQHFYAAYAGSAEEAADLRAAYKKCGGDFARMIREEILFDNGKVADGEGGAASADEISRLRAAVEADPACDTAANDKWRRSTAPEAIAKLRRRMLKERREAEEALRELGLDNSSGGDGTTTNNNNNNNGGSGNSSGGMGALQALIKQRQQGEWNNMLAGLESRYGGAGAGGKKGKHTGGGSGKASGSSKREERGKAKNAKEKKRGGNTQKKSGRK